MLRPASHSQLLLSTFLIAGLTGCGGGKADAPPAVTSAELGAAQPAAQAVAAQSGEVEPPKRTLRPIALGGQAAANSDSQEISREAEVESVMEALKPLQIMLGTWRGITQKAVNGFKAVDEPSWVWDFQTEPEQPALVMTSGSSPYFREARLTYLPDDQKYEMTAVDPEGGTRVYRGEYAKPPEDIPGDNDQLQRTYKLELTQVEPADDTERWQVVFNQQENNRYLLELYRKRGNASFLRYDTVATQREGTSFALSDTDYGEKTCIISEGLGTISVSYAGKSYWVCCTGCKAAFEEEPERWLAKLAERQKKK